MMMFDMERVCVRCWSVKCCFVSPFPVRSALLSSLLYPVFSYILSLSRLLSSHSGIHILKAARHVLQISNLHPKTHANIPPITPPRPRRPRASLATCRTHRAASLRDSLRSRNRHIQAELRGRESGDGWGEEGRFAVCKEVGGERSVCMCVSDC